MQFVRGISGSPTSLSSASFVGSALTGFLLLLFVLKFGMVTLYSSPELEDVLLSPEDSRLLPEVFSSSPDPESSESQLSSSSEHDITEFPEKLCAYEVATRAVVIGVVVYEVESWTFFVLLTAVVDCSVLRCCLVSGNAWSTRR